MANQEGYTEKEARAIILLNEWINKHGHDQCWYYPDIFRKLCDVFGVKQTFDPQLPPLEEFKAGCCRYQLELYSEKPK